MKHRSWEIIGVFDDTGSGHASAYTRGLASEAGYEVHVGAHPLLGEDAGLDWHLSARDCAGFVDEFAERLLADNLRPGMELVEFVDGGQTRLVFVVGEPVPPEVVGAYMLAPDALVLPLRWSLHREQMHVPAEPHTKDDLECELHVLTLEYWNEHEFSVGQVVEALQAMVESWQGLLCLDCGIDTLKDPNYRPVREEVWEEVPPQKRRRLCIACPSAQLGRVLVADDCTELDDSAADAP